MRWRRSRNVGDSDDDFNVDAAVDNISSFSVAAVFAKKVGRRQRRRRSTFSAPDFLSGATSREKNQTASIFFVLVEKKFKACKNRIIKVDHKT